MNKIEHDMRALIHEIKELNKDFPFLRLKLKSNNKKELVQTLIRSYITHLYLSSTNEKKSGISYSFQMITDQLYSIVVAESMLSNALIETNLEKTPKALYLDSLNLGKKVKKAKDSKVLEVEGWISKVAQHYSVQDYKLSNDEKDILGKLYTIHYTLNQESLMTLEDKEKYRAIIEEEKIFADTKEKLVIGMAIVGTALISAYTTNPETGSIYFQSLVAGGVFFYGFAFIKEFLEKRKSWKYYTEKNSYITEKSI